MKCFNSVKKVFKTLETNAFENFMKAIKIYPAKLSMNKLQCKLTDRFL